MCLSVPARVTAVHDASWATVEVGGTSKRISIDLVEDVRAGDYVLLHVGFALQKIDEDEALATLALLDEIARAETDPSEAPAEDRP
ncbi:MAG TPA: HypC/HybG/HupF family hydrogenase formation chaperone [Chloroflexota bacterium]|nr:HypC/HybG/HupF family hydrogenase formation chaperone [Chloroflexota bacterium]